MPYVEGFGTWPFGEEWLWEAIATSYLPLLDVLDAHPGRVTVSLTPVLCDQLEAPGALERCLAFLREVRPESHRLDIEAADPQVAAVLERSAAAYAAAADALERRGDLVAAFAPHVSWTSAATHAILPLLATGTGVRLQLRTGIAAHRARFGDWDGGLWLPECAHAPWLDDMLEDEGVRVICVDWTDVLGPGPRPPRCTRAGVVLAPLDREAIELVWHPARLPVGRPVPGHAPPDRAPPSRVGERRLGLRPDRAAAQAVSDAEDFVERVAARGGPSVVALDTELLGHFWPEGIAWLRAVLEACERRGLELAPPGAGATEAAPAAGSPRGARGATCAPGAGRRRAAWRGCSARPSCGRSRAAAVRATGRCASCSRCSRRTGRSWPRPAPRGDYPRERADGHRAAFEAALADPEMDPALRNLAPFL